MFREQNTETAVALAWAAVVEGKLSMIAKANGIEPKRSLRVYQ